MWRLIETKKPAECWLIDKMEARPGVEPRSTDLQSAAWPLCQRAVKTQTAVLFYRVALEYGMHSTDSMQ